MEPHDLMWMAKWPQGGTDGQFLACFCACCDIACVRRSGMARSGFPGRPLPTHHTGGGSRNDVKFSSPASPQEHGSGVSRWPAWGLCPVCGEILGVSRADTYMYVKKDLGRQQSSEAAHQWAGERTAVWKT